MKKSSVILFAMLASSLSLASAKTTFMSRYTSIEEKDCVQQPRPRENPDFSQMFCKGLGRYKVAVGGEEAYGFLDVRVGDRGADLPVIDVADPEGLESWVSGKKVEWRMRSDNGGKTQRLTALIFRYNTGDAKTGNEYLLVARLNGLKSCLVAKIDARKDPHANETARDFSDHQAAAAPCLKAPATR